MKNISVIGSGTMGNGIAHVFAQGGHNVALIDISADSLERALGTISKNLDRQHRRLPTSFQAKKLHPVLARRSFC